MLAKAYSATPRGVEALFVTVEVDRIRAQQPSVTVVGLPDTAVREARERIFAAIRHLGRRSEPANVVINLAPADQKKEGTGLDLPMAMAFLAAVGDVPAAVLEDRILLGELSLEGRLQPVRGVLPIVLAARERGIDEVVVPSANHAEAEVVSGVRVIAASRLGEVVRYLRDGRTSTSGDRGDERSSILGWRRDRPFRCDRPGAGAARPRGGGGWRPPFAVHGSTGERKVDAREASFGNIARNE